MLSTAGKFEQLERVEEYFKLLLQYHQPTPRTFHIMMQAYSQLGHTNKVLALLQQMREGCLPLVESRMRNLQPIPAKDALEDPTVGNRKLYKKLQSNATFSFPLTEKALFFLIQSHAVNNDTGSIMALLHQLQKGEEIFPNANKLHLTVPMTELFMHVFALHQRTDSALQLLKWVEASGVPLSTNAAWSFFDAFKRRRAMDQLEQQGKHGMMQVEKDIRQQHTPPDTDAAFKNSDVSIERSKDVSQQRPAGAPLPTHLQVRHPSLPAIRDPFPASVASTSAPLPFKTFPQAPRRKQMRELRASPVDSIKESQVPFAHVIEDMIKLHQFVPTARLFNKYLAYYYDNFYPPLGKFPDVMLEQVRVMEQTCNAEAVNAAFEDWKSNDAAHTRLSVDPPQALQSLAFKPFEATSETYSLLIQALMDRNPLRSSSPSLLALHPAGPSDADLRQILKIRSEMTNRHMEPMLNTKVNMMQLMVYEERWTDLYASFTLLWKREKLRRESKLRNIQLTSPTVNMEQMLSKEEQDAQGDSVANPSEEASKSDAALEDLTPNSPTASYFTTQFSCMSLVPVFVSLSQRQTLDRFNLFFGVVAAAKDFPLTRNFFQCILQILSERGQTNDIIGLLKVVKSKYHIQPTVKQYNSLLASMMHPDVADTAQSIVTDEGVVKVKSKQKANQKEVVSNMFQTWELMKLLHIGYNQQTLTTLLAGCLHYGELIDGQRLWSWLTHKSPHRPSLLMYTFYIELLIKHNQLMPALEVLRSQSFKDGLDWSLKECNLILDFVKSGKLLPLANKIAPKDPNNRATTETQDDTNGSALTEEQLQSVYVPTSQQLSDHAYIVAQAKALSLSLLALEKKGGKFGRKGLLEATLPGSVQSHALKAHRAHYNPLIRLEFRTWVEKEEDEILHHTSIPGHLFHPKLVPLIKSIEQFTGDSQAHQDRIRVKNEMKLLGESENDQSRQSHSLASDATAIAQLSKHLLGDEPISLASIKNVTASDFSTPSSSEETPAMEVAKKKAAKQGAKKAKKEKASKEKTTTDDENSALSLADVPQTGIMLSLQLTLETLVGKADRVNRSPFSQLEAPSHPAKLGEVNLCELRANDKLSSLTIAQLKQIQTSESLMAQPKELVKGIKSHHVTVAQAWLDHCSCAMHKKH